MGWCLGSSGAMLSRRSRGSQIVSTAGTAQMWVSSSLGGSMPMRGFSIQVAHVGLSPTPFAGRRWQNGVDFSWDRTRVWRVSRASRRAQWDETVGLGPLEGNLETNDLYSLIDVLGRHTDSSERCFFCIWDGYGCDHRVCSRAVPLDPTTCSPTRSLPKFVTDRGSSFPTGRTSSTKAPSVEPQHGCTQRDSHRICGGPRTGPGASPPKSTFLGRTWPGRIDSSRICSQTRALKGCLLILTIPFIMTMTASPHGLPLRLASSWAGVT